METIDKILPYVIPLVLLVWIFIGIFIIRQKIDFSLRGSRRLRRGIRRLDLGKNG